jgi:ubiquinone/menaquinone biosynthesis C-methylase UbiE
MDPQGSLWPAGFDRIPGEPWVTAPIDPLGEKYASMAGHRWYSNLDLTVEQLAGAVRPGDLIVDYSGGTGILAGRVLKEIAGVGVLIVDSSPRFLRVAVEKLGRDPRVAFRLLHWLSERQRLQRLEEAVGPLVVARGADAIVSTNAVHVYPDPHDTFQTWWRVIRPGGQVFIQSGDIRNPQAPSGEWLISEVVEQVREVAKRIVLSDPRYQPYRAVLADANRMSLYDGLWRKLLLPVRSIREYQASLTAAGFFLRSSATRTIEVGVLEWYEAMSVFPDVLAWVGGSAKVDGHPPSTVAVADRLALLKQSLLKVFGGRDTYLSTWSYITAQR